MKAKLLKHTNQYGFTLIELMVVIVILGFLAAFIGPKLVGQADKGRDVRARMDIQALETALKMYKLENGVYPSTEQGLQALIEKPGTGTVPKNWRKGGYMEKSIIPKDPWKNEYVYLSPGAHGDFDIVSYGADGVAGGEDENKDINNWEIE